MQRHVARSPDGIRTNRIPAILAHGWKLSFHSQATLAEAAGYSPSTISRVCSGKQAPTRALMRAVLDALEEDFGFPFEESEVFSADGSTYPTASACELTGCGGCMPDSAFTARGDLKPAWRSRIPGDWSLSPANR